MNHLDTIRKAANPGGDPVLPIAIQPSPGTSTTVTIDGYWGAATTRAVQRLLGLTADGIISSQDIYWQSRNPGLTTGWEWVGSSSAIGSRTIQALQRLCGLAADGLIGPNTIKALQRRMGTPIDGKIDEQSSFIMALQSRLNRGTI
ncbi:peptidoglycan-binding domain-containing protein [Schaalia vaccimaxillae]|uniref:peptidoglycan-binding domain-containing protein n=1 Tax=Schaalia vaccimaxillae TaxID=183916 RepID=UPI001FB0A545|nr:peptidoglycan-binding domain-containing protein [Schaalia vaccimaxillae]